MEFGEWYYTTKGFRETDFNNIVKAVSAKHAAQLGADKFGESKIDVPSRLWQTVELQCRVLTQS